MYNKVYVEITNICNRNCSFCHGHSRPSRQMSKEEFDWILDKLTEHTKYIYYHLMGEPLVHPQLHEFIALAGARGYKSILTTNGTLLCDRQEEILNAGVHKVNLSLHSFEEDNNEEHIRYLRSLADFAQHAVNAGTIVVFRLWNKGIDDARNEFVLKLLKQMLPGDWNENNRGIRIREKIFVDMSERFEWPDLQVERKENRFYCYGLKDQFGILVDGTVVPCCLDSEGTMNLGNVFKEDIGEILSSKRARDILEGFQCGKAVEELCKRCGYAQRFAY